MQFRHMSRALSHPNYRLFFFGQGVSLLGTWMQSIAMSWLVYRLTHSVYTLGLIGFADKAPVFLITPFIGVFLDRYNRYKTVVIAQVVMMMQAFILGVLTVSGQVEVWHVGVLAALLGFANAVDIPARQSLLVEMLDDKADLSNGIAMNSIIFNSARLVGPSIAGFLLGFVSEGICFFMNAASFLFVLFALLRMNLRPRAVAAKQTHAWHDLKEGWRYAWNFPPTRSILFLLAFTSLVGMPFTVLLPVVATQYLGGGARTLGLLMGATGAGALIAALTLASRKNVVGLDRWIPRAAGLFGFSLIAFAFSRNLALSFILLLVGGFGMMMHMAASNTIIQTIVDDSKRGRVMSLYVLSITGMAPLGSYFAGWVADKIGVSMTLAFGGAGCAAGAFLFLLKLPEIRELIHPVYSKLGIFIPEEDVPLQGDASN